MNVCSECGKEFDVLYQDLWRYRTGTRWFCSWHCLRADERKRKEDYGMERLKKDGTPAKKPGPKKAVNVETPEAPVQCVAHVSPVELEEAEHAVADLVLQGGVNYQLKVEEDRRKDIEWTIPAIRHCVFGEWYYDQEHNRIDWRTPEGDEVSFSPDGWKQLMNDILPEALKRLGVK